MLRGLRRQSVPDPMATPLSFDCDWLSAASTNPLGLARVGYLLAWSGCGGLNLTTDIQVNNPYPASTIVSGSTVSCIGFIERFKFNGEDNGPIKITAYVGADNAANLLEKLATPLTSTSVQVSWCICSFDSASKAWYEAAYVDGGANASANIDTAKGKLGIGIDDAPTPVPDGTILPVFYRFKF